jgi:hypothetical protein
MTTQQRSRAAGAESWRAAGRTLAVLATLLLATAAPADVLVSLPDDASGTPGQSIEVCLTIDPVDGMLAADVDIAYDDSVLLATDVQKTTLLQDFTLTKNINDPGWVRISLFGTQAVTGGGCAVNITFDLLEAGCSLLDITRALINEGELPATLDDGNCEVEDDVDRDGDGYTEAGGDCSDRFDWIHPGAPELCNGADDDCDGQVDEDILCPCGAYVAPRGAGFWQRVCNGSSLEESITPEYVDYVNDYATFAGVADESGVCAVLLPALEDSCATGELEFMALLLNLASGRLCLEQEISASSTDALDVNEAVGEVDALLSNAGRTPADCDLARDISREISSGEAIPEYLDAEVELEVRKQSNAAGTATEAIVIHWIEPDAGAAGRAVTYELHRSPDSPYDWAKIGETLCTTWLPDFTGPGNGAELLLYQVIGVTP